MSNKNTNYLIKHIATVKVQLDEHIAVTRQLRDEAAAHGDLDRLLHLDGALKALLAFRADWNSGFIANRKEVSK